MSLSVGSCAVPPASHAPKMSIPEPDHVHQGGSMHEDIDGVSTGQCLARPKVVCRIGKNAAIMLGTSARVASIAQLG
jgi:hypothetical protein